MDEHGPFQDEFPMNTFIYTGFSWIFHGYFKQPDGKCIWMTIIDNPPSGTAELLAKDNRTTGGAGRGSGQAAS